jgi:AraC-type DNA-binding domain-containing proteins
MRLLLVDDEELIVDGLYEIFYYERDYETYKAYSAKEAVCLLEKMRFDVVVSDIQMPGMDGIGLAEEIIARWPWCRIVFLTGHSEFDYVYKAIQRQNVQFLLKTEDTDRLLDVVDLAVHYIKAEDEAKKLQKQVQEQILIAKDMFQNDYLDRVLSGKIVPHHLELKKLGIGIDMDYPVLLVVASMDLEDNNDYYERTEKIQAIKNLIFRKLATKVRINIVVDNNFQLSLLVQSDKCSQSYQQIKVFIAGMIEIIQNTCKENLNVDVSFVMSKVLVEWCDIPRKVSGMRIELNKSIGSVDQVLLSEKEGLAGASQIEDNSRVESILKEKFSSFGVDKAIRFMEIGKEEDFFKVVTPTFDTLRRVKNLEEPIAQEVFLTVTMLLMSHINKYDLRHSLLSGDEQRKLASIYEHNSYRIATDFLIDIAKRIFKSRQLSQRSHSEEIVYMVEKYIRENLRDDISLVSLGEQVYLNPAYLSRLYKQVKGSNISSFIDVERITLAKELLKDGNKKIVDIAKKVGYENASSFTRLFKKIVGMTPQEYRVSKGRV